MISPGSAVSIFLLWLWVTIAVGPWWIGVGILIIGAATNWAAARRSHDDVIRR